VRGCEQVVQGGGVFVEVGWGDVEEWTGLFLGLRMWAGVLERSLWLWVGRPRRGLVVCL
jgi:hypothetical protein